MTNNELSKVKEAIEQVTTMILEDWGMMLVDQADSNINIFSNNENFLVSMVRFKGIVNGQYSIVCQKEFASSLAKNVLGLDEEPAEQDQKDALKEMANVLCGNMLTECYGDEEVFDLTPPEIAEFKPKEIQKYFDERTVCCLADDSPVAATFSIDISE
jgi:CheY-specific phosphatase CheX